MQSEYGQNLKSGDIKKMLEKELEDYFSKLHRKWKSTARTAIKNLADSAGTGICFIRSSRSSMKKIWRSFTG